MPSTFGTVLRRFRENRGLSLREIGQLADMDHAYIHRLETGEKEAPSEETLARLFRVLKVGDRNVQILRFLVGKDIDIQLVDTVLDDSSIDLEDFKSAALMSFRGKPMNWTVVISKIRKLRKGLEHG